MVCGRTSSYHIHAVHASHDWEKQGPTDNVPGARKTCIIFASQTLLLSLLLVRANRFSTSPSDPPPENKLDPGPPTMKGLQDSFPLCTTKTILGKVALLSFAERHWQVNGN
mgnify:CR=1 FL=1